MAIFGLIPHVQARLLARHLRGDVPSYQPFIQVDLSTDMRNNRIAEIITELVDISRFEISVIASSLRAG